MKSDDVYVPNYIRRKITPIKMDGTGAPTESNTVKVIDNNQYVNFDVPSDHSHFVDSDGIDDLEVPEAFETSKDLSSYEDDEEDSVSMEEDDEYLLMYKKEFLMSGSKEKIEKDMTRILLDGLNGNTSVEQEDLTVFKKINIGFGAYLKE